jgi:hypothetical protein
MRSILRYGGVAASIVLIAMGIGAIVVGASGHGEIGDSLKREAIVGTPDMTPTATAAAVKEAGLTGVEIPDCSVANKPIDSGGRAKCFASYMRIHALEATGGKTYAQMPRFQTADGQGTNDEAEALKGDSGQPLSNPAREIWVTETALSTALNTSYFAQSVAVFSIVMGIALLLTGIGFLVLTTGLLAGAGALLRERRGANGPAPVAPAAG